MLESHSCRAVGSVVWSCASELPVCVGIPVPITKSTSPKEITRQLFDDVLACHRTAGVANKHPSLQY